MKYTLLLLIAIPALAAAWSSESQCKALNPPNNAHISNCATRAKYSPQWCHWKRNGNGGHISGCNKQNTCTRSRNVRACWWCWWYNSQCYEWEYHCSHYAPANNNGYCAKCSSGYYLHSGRCHACGNDYVCDGSSTRQAKQSCAAGYERQGANGNSHGTCVQCSKGLHKSNTGTWKTKCAYCNIHFYETNSRKSCTKCPSNCSCHSGRKFCGAEDLDHLAKLAALQTHAQKVALQKELNDHTISQAQLSKLQSSLQTENNNLKKSISNAEGNRDSCNTAKNTLSSQNGGLRNTKNTNNKNINTQQGVVSTLEGELRAAQSANAVLSNDLAICNNDLVSLAAKLKDSTTKMHNAGAKSLLESADFITSYEAHSRRYMENAVAHVDTKVANLEADVQKLDRPCYYTAGDIKKYDAQAASISASLTKFDSYSKTDVVNQYSKAKDLCASLRIHLEDLKKDNARAPAEQQAGQDVMDELVKIEMKVEDTLKAAVSFPSSVAKEMDAMRKTVANMSQKKESDRLTSTLTHQVEAEIAKLTKLKPCTREIDAVACKWYQSAGRVFVDHHKQVCAHDGSACTCTPKK